MAKTKFKVGQKVKVREDLVVDNRYNNFAYFAPAMSDFRGREVTIKEVVKYGDKDIYRLNEDTRGWSWSEDMLTAIIVKVKPQKILVEKAVQPEMYVESVIVNNPATIVFYRMANYDHETGEFLKWGDTKKSVAKCNVDAGDTYDLDKGIAVAVLKAYRKEIDKRLRKV